jgi:2-polyprenyl-6-hydroxyphenyl methylase/3-demethylubiquinone-9 3-methyltransferase
VTTPFHGYYKNLALAITGKYDKHWHPLRDYGHVKFFSHKTLSALFEEQGFAVRNYVRVGRIPNVRPIHGARWCPKKLKLANR